MPSQIKVPQLPLNTGAEIPQIGFGTFQVPPEDTAETVRTALDAGYRSIDTAAAYGNEEGVGRAVVDSDLSREELFVTTKLWNKDHGRQSALRAFDAGLGRLGLWRLDLRHLILGRAAALGGVVVLETSDQLGLLAALWQRPLLEL